MSEVSVRAVTGGEVAARLEAISTLYQQTFAVPPNVAESPAEHRATMLSLLANPTFGCALAADSNGELIGFAYGRTLTSDRWWEGLRTPVPEGFTTEWDGRTFAVIDIGISPRWRRHHIGTRLMDTLLAARPEQRASLGMIPALEDTAAFYAATGWELVGRQDSPRMLAGPHRYSMSTCETWELPEAGKRLGDKYIRCRPRARGSTPGPVRCAPRRSTRTRRGRG
ncbi:GNAT family N-acetyltransferase [Nocardia sp. SYP-A9097]|uniref:GNAT family N-acetyltransferase n=1 Tax=Nocardia sp. SYP-A9097 TaxID=2663237 RepID=UPI0018914138|nr:GNAT family N-acetyltransferase [Nocardia sp. SYP-A9097]